MLYHWKQIASKQGLEIMKVLNHIGKKDLSKSIVRKLSEENLVNGIKWLLHNRPVCPPLKRTLLRNVVEEWASFLPLTGDNLDPSTMLSNFNVLLATASYLLTQKEFCHLSSGVVAPEFLPKSVAKSYDIASNSLRESYLNWFKQKI